jgi:3-deoxy-7-phosphoheptulonate synthase
MRQTSDLRIAGIQPLISPADLKERVPITENSSRVVVESRQIIADILERRDRRMLAIVGPCSIHDSAAAIEYARMLSDTARRIEEHIYVVMRVYFEKPRTSVGWKGFITDPYLNDSDDIEDGLRLARKLLLDITGIGLPAASELLDPIVPQYISDLISWAAIGARTTESQTHREMASGLSMPVGFKNGTSGNLRLAVDAIRSSRHPHSFLGIDQAGQTSIVRTTGNPHCHMIMRGGRSGPNYYEEDIEAAESIMAESGIDPVLLVDCSHGNSAKSHSRQFRVLKSILEQRMGERKSIVGFMIESNLNPGTQLLPENRDDLEYGVSITDPCVGWDETREMLEYAYRRLE